MKEWLAHQDSVIRNPVGATQNFACRDMRQFDFLTLSSKLEREFADDNFKFDKKKRQKVLQKVGDTEGKGEIACYEQFRLFPQCFQKTWNEDT